MKGSVAPRGLQPSPPRLVSPAKPKRCRFGLHRRGWVECTTHSGTMRLQAILYIFHCIAAPDHFVRAIWSRTTRSLYVRTRKVKRWIQRWSNDECSEDVLHTILVNSTYCTIFVRHVMSSGKRPIQLACTIQLGLNALFSNETYYIQHVWVKDNAAIRTTLCAKQCGKQRQRWCQRKQNIHSGLVWMHVYLLQSMCWSGLEWNLVQLHYNPFEHMWIEMNTCASNTRPLVGFEWSSNRIILRWVNTSSPYHMAEKSFVFP